MNSHSLESWSGRGPSAPFGRKAVMLAQRLWVLRFSRPGGAFDHVRNELRSGPATTSGRMVALVIPFRSSSFLVGAKSPMSLCPLDRERTWASRRNGCPVFKLNFRAGDPLTAKTLVQGGVANVRFPPIADIRGESAGLRFQCLLWVDSGQAKHRAKSDQ